MNQFSQEFTLVGEKQKDYKSGKISRSADADSIFRRIIGNDMLFRENFVVLYLNNSNDEIGWFLVSKGGLTGTIVDIRTVIKCALDCMAAKIIIAHNHPSGRLNPSRQDEQITERLKKAAELFGIDLIDHIILSEESYLSFIDEGLL